MLESISREFLVNLLKLFKQIIVFIQKKYYDEALEKLMSLSLQIDILIGRLETLIKLKKREK